MKTDFVVGKTASESLYPLGANVSTAINKTPILRNANIRMIGHHRISAQIQSKDLGQVVQFIFNPLAVMLIGLSRNHIRAA